MEPERSWDPDGHDVPRWVVPAAVLALALILTMVIILLNLPTTP
jgi:hypothetical protein